MIYLRSICFLHLCILDIFDASSYFLTFLAHLLVTFDTLLQPFKRPLYSNSMPLLLWDLSPADNGDTDKKLFSLPHPTKFMCIARILYHTLVCIIMHHLRFLFIIRQIEETVLKKGCQRYCFMLLYVCFVTDR